LNDAQRVTTGITLTVTRYPRLSITFSSALDFFAAALEVFAGALHRVATRRENGHEEYC
jgi:hypothetical protein